MPTAKQHSIPKLWAQNHGIVPMEVNSNLLVVGSKNKADNALEKELTFITGKEIEVREVTKQEYNNHYESYYGTIPSLDLSHSDGAEFKKQKPEIGNLSNRSVVQQVNTIIDRAIEMGASDIHVEPFEEQVRLRYRLDGVLKQMGEVSLVHKNAVISRLKIMANLDIAEKRRPQDGRIRMEKDNKNIDLRVSTLPTDFGEKVVLRILDKSEQRLDLRELGFGNDELLKFRKSINHPYGMILVTGPTGSGKTTTLYGALNELNTDQVNITTIEDPIEYNLFGINQTHVRSDIGLTFSHALRSILRQDPNIIMVGEIRDLETAEIAIRAALTGHLVLSTLHTNDAPSAIARLIDMGIEPFLVASSVRLVMAQRLVRKICSSCEKTYQPDPELLKDVGLSADAHNFIKGDGCPDCNETGYKGRTALFEMMPMSDEISSLVVDRAGANQLKRQAQTEGMKTLQEAGVKKIENGLTTPEEVARETVV